MASSKNPSNGKTGENPVAYDEISITDVAETESGKGDAQAKVEPVSVPRPEAGRVVTVEVEGGKPLALAFDRGDIERAELIGDDLVLNIDGGGQVILKDYLVAFGLADGLKTEVTEKGGESFSITELLTSASGGDKEKDQAEGKTEQQKETTAASSELPDLVLSPPGEGEVNSVRLRPGQDLQLRFTPDDVERSFFEDDGDFVLLFANGGRIVFPELQSFAFGNPDIAVKLPAGFTINGASTINLLQLSQAYAGGPEGQDDSELNSPYDPGDIGPGLDHLGPLGNEELAFTAPEPDANPLQNLLGELRDEPAPVDQGEPNGNADPIANPDGPPVANADLFQVNPCAPQDIEVLANDTDPDGDTLSITAIDGQAVIVGTTVTLASGATATLINSSLGDPTKLHAIRYDPPPGFNGTEQFSYTITDGNGGFSTTTVSVFIPVTNEWMLMGDANVTEGGDANYVVSFNGTALNAGESRFVDIRLEFPPAGSTPEPAEEADFLDAQGALFDEISRAAQGLQGVTVTSLANGDVRIQFDSSATAAVLGWNMTTLLDGVQEGDEQYDISIGNIGAGGGAQVGSVSQTMNAVNTVILEGGDGIPAAWELTGDIAVNEGAGAVYTLGYSGVTLDPGESVSIELMIDLPGGLGFAEAADFRDSFFQDIADAIGGIQGVTLQGTRLVFDDTAPNAITFALPTIDDNLIEGAEDYTVSIKNPSPGGTIGLGQDAVTTTIIDNEPNTWSITGDATVPEGQTADYILSYQGPPIAPGDMVTVDVNIDLPGGLGGAEAADFQNAFLADLGNAVSGIAGITLVGNQIRIDDQATQTTVMFDLPTVQDLIFEGDESFTISLANPSGDTNISGTEGAVTTTIVDDDLSSLVWSISAQQTTVDEGSIAQFEIDLGPAAIGPGHTASITLDVDLPGGATGAEADDFIASFFADVAAAVAALPPGSGITFDQSTGVLTAASNATFPFSFGLETLDDGLFEADELFAVTISDPQIDGAPGGTVAQGSATTTIVDNDGQNLVWELAGAPTVIEGGTAGYTIDLSGAEIAPGNSASITVEIDFTGFLDPASAADFVETFNKDLADAVAQAPGVTRVGNVLTFDSTAAFPFTFELPTLQDALDEADESFLIRITNPSAGTVGGANNGEVATVILDDDAPDGPQTGPFLVVDDVQVDESATQVTFTITRTGDLSGSSTVGFTTADGSATAGQDYAPSTGSVSFASGQSTATVTVDLLPDNDIEGDETFDLQLSNPVNADLSDPLGTATVLDDDDAGSAVTRFAISDGIGVEGAGNVITFTVTREGDTSVPQTIGFETEPGSASEGSDFIPSAGTVTFNAGQDTATIVVALADDSEFEGREAFAVNLLNPPSGTEVVDPTGVGFILDDETASTGTFFSIDSVTVDEAAGQASFTVTRTGDTQFPSAVTAATDPDAGTATAGVDYTPKSQTFIFDAGETAKSFTVDITPDLVAEGLEQFFVNLSNPTNGEIINKTGVGTIVDDDSPDGPTPNTAVAIDDVKVDEDAGFATFTVTRTGDLSGSSTVNFATASGTATQDVDFTGQVGTVVFAAGETAQTIDIAITDDLISGEGEETFFVNLTGATGAIIVDDQGVGIIADNDPQDTAVRFGIEGATVSEGETAVFTVTRFGDASVAADVEFLVLNGSAEAGSDFTVLTGSPVSFAPGVTEQQIQVQTANDVIQEGTETFLVQLTNTSAGTIAVPNGVGTILESTTPTNPTQWSVDSVTVNEGDGVATFTVTRAGDASGAATVQVSTIDGSAMAGSDYTALTNFSVNFADGQTAATFDVAINDDALVENDEVFFVQLTNASEGQIVGATGTGRILDNETTQPPAGTTLAINDVQVDEAGGTAVFTVTRAGDLSGPSTVNFASASGSADQGFDFGGVSGTLSFAAGEAVKTVSVSIIDDLTPELDETFNILLSNATGATVTDAIGTGTIVDNDTGGTEARLAIQGTTVTEQPGGTVATFTVTRLGDPSGTASVDFQTIDGSATQGLDYQFSQGTINFADGQTAATIQVNVLDDSAFEGSESFLVELSNPVNAEISVPTAVGTILDDETPTQQSLFSVDSVTVSEDAGFATFTVTRTGDTTATQSVSFTTADGTAVAGADYAAINGTLTFGAGVSEQTVTVQILDDQLIEGPELFTLNLSSPTNGAGILDGTGIGTIVDNEAENVTWQITGDTTVAEGSAASYTVGYSGVTLLPGQTLSIALNLDLPVGGEPTSADFDFINDSFLDQIAAQIGPGDGLTLSGNVLTFDATANPSFTFDLPTLDDAEVEGPETYTVRIDNPSEGTIAAATVDTTITDNDTPPEEVPADWTIVGDATVDEGAAAGYTLSFSGVNLTGSQTTSIDLLVDLPGGSFGAEAADFQNAFLADVQGAIDALPAGHGLSLSGSRLTFSAGGVSSFSFDLPTVAGDGFENNESYTVRIANPIAGSTLVQATADTTIIDGDNNIQWSLDGTRILTEGDTATYTVGYTGITLGAGQEISVRIGIDLPGDTAPTVPGGASAADFVNAFLDDVEAAANAAGVAFDRTTGELTFGGGDPASLQIALQTLDDALPETLESYTVEIDQPSAGTIDQNQDVVGTTIIDNDSWFVTGDPTVTEGETASYTIGLSNVTLQPGQTAEIDVGLTFLTAEPADLAESLSQAINAAIAAHPQGAGISFDGTTLTFDSTVQPIELTFDLTAVIDAPDSPETYRVEISNPNIGIVQLGAGNVQTEIQDIQDVAPEWQLTGTSTVLEGGAPSYTLAITNGPLAPGQTESIDITFGPLDTESADFVDTFLKDLQDAAASQSGVTVSGLGNTVTVTFDDTASAFNFTLPTFDDAVFEGPEDFSLSLGGQTAGNIVGSPALTTTITDNDGDGFAWRIDGDLLVRESETANPPSYTVSYSGGTFEAGATVSVDLDINLPSGFGGADAADFLESFAKDLADAAATQSGVSTQVLPSGQVRVTFADPAVTSFDFTLPLFNDNLAEEPENFTITIDGVSNGSVERGVITTAIVDDDAGNLEWSVDGPASVTEGDTATFTIDVSNSNFGQDFTAGITVDLAFVALEGNPAASADDFGGSTAFLDAVEAAAAAATGVTFDRATSRLTFDNTATFPFSFDLPTIDDGLAEGTETFRVEIRNPSDGAIVQAMADSQIVDAAPPDVTWSITGDGAVNEGDAASYTISYSGATLGSGQSISIDASLDFTGVANDPAELADFAESLAQALSDAAAGNPDVSVSGTTVTFTGPGATSFTFTLQTAQDTALEGPEDYRVVLSQTDPVNPVGTIVDGEEITTINDDEAAGVQWVLSGDTSVTEGAAASYTVGYIGAPLQAGSTVSVALTFILPGGATGAEAADFDPADVIAQFVSQLPAGVSYDSTTNRLTFDSTAPQTFSFDLQTADDNLAELDEAYTLLIDNPDVGAVSGAGIVSTVISDQDSGALQWSVSGPASVDEGAAATFSIDIASAQIADGKTVSVDIGINFIGIGGLDAAEAADFQNAFLDDVAAAAASAAGVTLSGTTLTFDENATLPFSFDLPTVSDMTSEGGETFQVEISNASDGTIVTPTADTIINDTSAGMEPVLIGVNDPVVVEEAGTVTFVLTRQGDLSLQSQIDFATVDGTAVAGTDYLMSTGTVTFAAGQEQAEVTIQLLDDAVPEVENFFLQLSNPLPAGQTGVSDGRGEATLFDTDVPCVPRPIAVSDVSVNEGAGFAVFTVTRGGDLSEASTVDFETASASAVEGLDFARSSGTLNFAAGVSEMQVAVQILNDTLAEPQEEFTLNLSNAENGPIVDATGVARIAQSDGGGGGAPLLAVDDVTVNEGSGQVTFTVTRTGDAQALNAASTVNFATADASATAGSDYVSTSGQLSFAAGETSKTVTVDILQDSDIEFSTAFTLNLSNATGAQIADATGIGTITDDDTNLVNLAFRLGGQAIVTEGDAPSYTLSYDGATLAAGQTVSVELDIDLPGGLGGAEAADFLAAFFADVDGALPAGVTRSGNVITFDSTAPSSVTFTLPTADDTLPEGIESYTVFIENPSAGVIENGAGNEVPKAVVGTSILDNEVWTITGDTAVTEGNTANYTVELQNVTLSAGQTASIDVNIEFPAGEADASDLEVFTTAVAAAAAGAGVGATVVDGNTVRLTFDSSNSPIALDFGLDAIADGIAEGPEDYVVTISNPSISNVQIGGDRVRTEITDEALNVDWQITSPDTDINEGEAPSYTVSYSGATLVSGQTLEIDLAVNLPGGLAGAEAADFIETFEKDLADAAAGTDGVDVSGTRVTFSVPAGGTAPSGFTFTLPTLQDSIDEQDENFEVSILNQSAGTIDPNANMVQTIIRDDDTASNPPDWALTGDVSVVEGGAPQYAVSYTGEALTGTDTVSIDLAIVLPGAPSGADAADFVESFLTDVGQAAAATPGVSLSGSTLTFSAGAPRDFVFTLPTLQENLDELDEIFTVRVQNPSSGTTIASGKNVVDTTIIDDDPPTGGPVEFAITGNAAVAEGGTPAYTILMSGGTPGEQASVDINAILPGGVGGAEAADFLNAFLADVGTAAAATAGVTLSGSTLTFDIGTANSLTFGLPTVDDSIFEGDESFSVSLSNAGGGSIDSQFNAVQTTILENDTGFQFALTGEQLASETAGAGEPDANAAYTITLNGPAIAAGQTVSVEVDLNLVGGPGGAELADFVTDSFLDDIAAAAAATQGASFDGATRRLTFDETFGGTFDFSLAIKDDNLFEGVENYTVILRNPSEGAVSGAGLVTTAIIDNDGDALDWTLTGSASVLEGADAGYTVGYTGTTLVEGQQVSVAIEFLPGTADTSDVGDLLTAIQNAINGLPADPNNPELQGDRLVFKAGGPTSLDFALPTVNDGVPEGTEDFQIQLVSPSAGNLPPAVTTEITEPAPDLVFNIGGSASIAEASAGSYTVSLSGGPMVSGQTASVDLDFTPGTATLADFDPADFLAQIQDDIASLPAGSGISLSGNTLTFTAGGATNFTFDLQTLDDGLLEGDETFSVDLSNAQATTPSGGAPGATLGTSSASTTIVDGDLANVQWAIGGDALVNEGADASYTISYSGATLTAGQTISIDARRSFAGVSGDPAEAADFNATVAQAMQAAAAAIDGVDVVGNTITFSVPAGGGPAPTSFAFSLPITADGLDEPDEFYKVELSNQTSGTTVATGSVETRIVDGDAAPVFNIGPDVTVTEGGDVVVTVTKSGSTAQTATVDIATANGTAIAGTDFNAISQTLTFAAGETAKSVTISTIDDAVDEPDESFTVNLSSPTNGTIGDGQKVVTITDNDISIPPSSFSVANTSVIEGDPGDARFLTFTVTRSGTGNFADGTASVDIEIDGGTATGGGVDYTDPGKQTLTFAAGETSKTFTVAVTEDDLDESNETVTVLLSNAQGPAGTAISDANATGTIIDDDTRTLFSVDDVTVTEGDTGTVNAVFTVTRTANGEPATVRFATADGSATAGSDYVGTSGTLTFGALETSKTVTVVVNGDTAVEPDETFFLNLSSPTSSDGAGFNDNQGQGTIVNDDALNPSTFAVNNTSVTEGDPGQSRQLVFTVTRSGTGNFADAAASVDIEINGGTALAGTDYSNPGKLTLNFAAGETSKTYTVPIIEDDLDESNETVTVLLSNAQGPAGTGIGDANGIGTIIDDDTRTLFSVNNVAVDEGDTGTVNAVFTVTRTANGEPASVQFFTSNDSATAGSDYIATSGTLNFAANETAKTVTVVVNGDTVPEGLERFFLNLTNPTSPDGAGLADGQGIGSIRDTNGTGGFDTDSVFSLAPLPPDNVSGPNTERDPGDSPQVMSWRVFRDGDLSAGHALDWQIVSASTGASVSADLSGPTSGTIFWSDGQTAEVVGAFVVGDLINELDEAFELILTPSGGDSLDITPGAQFNGITDDDSTNAWTIEADFAASGGFPGPVEGDSGVTGQMVWTITRSITSGSGEGQIGVRLFGAGTDATPGVDFENFSQVVLTFAPGETQKQITLDVFGDTVAEADEAVTLQLFNPNPGLDDDTGYGAGAGILIQDDDTATLTSLSSADDQPCAPEQPCAPDGQESTVGVVRGANPEAKAGAELAALGDVNGDGFEDYAVLAQGEDTVYVVFGAGEERAELNLSQLVAEGAGFALRGAGGIVGVEDLNGDGLADMVVGAADGSGAYVVYGTPEASDTALADIVAEGGGFALDGTAGDSSQLAAGDVDGDGIADLLRGSPDTGEAYITAHLDGSGGAPAVFFGGGSGDGFGDSVAFADLDGDGFDEAIVASRRADPDGRANAGSVHVISGVVAALGGNADEIAASEDGFRIIGAGEGDTITSVANIGDFNGDGIDDLAIGAGLADANDMTDNGTVYVVYGQEGGFTDDIDLAGLTREQGFAIHGSEDSAWFGLDVRSAGDVNGDGRDDLIVSAPLEDNGDYRDAGAMYVVFGQEGATDLNADGIVEASRGIRIGGAEANGGLAAVSSAGDLNGDGFDDLLAGFALKDGLDGGSDAGATFVVYGRDFAGEVTHLGTASDDSLAGTESADVMVGGLGNDILSGGGGFDALSGGAGDDLLTVADDGFLRVDGGAGHDTLVLDAAGETLDLTAMGDSRISSVEAIDIGGSGDNSLSLSFQDVLDVSEVGNTLTVLGDSGDTVSADFSGHKVAAEDHGAFTRYVIDGGVAHIDIENTINQNVNGDFDNI